MGFLVYTVIILNSISLKLNKSNDFFKFKPSTEKTYLCGFLPGAAKKTLSALHRSQKNKCWVTAAIVTMLSKQPY